MIVDIILLTNIGIILLSVTVTIYDLVVKKLPFRYVFQYLANTAAYGFVILITTLFVCHVYGYAIDYKSLLSTLCGCFPISILTFIILKKRMRRENERDQEN